MIEATSGELISLLVIAIGIVAVTLAARRKSSDTESPENKDTDSTNSTKTAKKK